MRDTSLFKRKIRNLLIRVARRAAIVVPVTLVILGALSFASHADFFAIDDVAVEGTEVLKEGEIEEVVESVLSGSYGFLFSRRNSFLYPRSNVSEVLYEVFPRIRHISVVRNDLNRITVFVQEREPSVTWCGPTRGRSGPCFYLDDDGLAFARAPVFSRSVFMRFYGGAIDPNRPVRSSFADPSEFVEIKHFLEALSMLNLTPREVYEDEGEYIITVHGGGEIILSDRLDLERSFERLYTLFRGSDEVFVERSTPRFSSIDLRFGERIFYEMKEDL